MPVSAARKVYEIVSGWSRDARWMWRRRLPRQAGDVDAGAGARQDEEDLREEDVQEDGDLRRASSEIAPPRIHRDRRVRFPEAVPEVARGTFVRPRRSGDHQERNLGDGQVRTEAAQVKLVWL